MSAKTNKMRQELFRLLDSELGPGFSDGYDYSPTDDTPEKIIAEAKQTLDHIQEAQRQLTVWLKRYS